MKRFWLCLLSLSMIMVFTSPAKAADLKVSGEFFVAGMYLDKTTLMKNVANEGPSTAFYYQRLRVQTDFIVSPGLSLTTRFDAMERAWGATRSTPGTVLDTQSQGTRAENENIAFDMAYVQYVSPVGIVAAGYLPESTWGTVFGNNSTSAGKISYTLSIKNFTFIGHIVKHYDASKTAINAAGYADADYNGYYLMALYRFKYGVVGLANFWLDNMTTRPLGYRSRIPLYLDPFVKAKIGPVALQAELLYQQGKRAYETPGNQDINISALAGWIDAVADFGMFYAGGTFAYVSGDNPDTADKVEGGTLTGGNDFDPCLILWNYDRAYWVGSLPGYDATTANGAAMTNGYLYQLRAGARPIDKLDIMGSVTYAYADQKPSGYQGRNYGWEIDLTAKYKITNNLSYVLGIGYLFTGDFYKGTTNNDLNNDYLVVNKLTLSF